MASAREIKDLYQGFLKPDAAQYGPRPLWYWNGEMSAEEIERQLEEMTSKGVFSAYIFPWAKMRPRYLSEGWWDAVGTAIRKARDLGFRLYFANEHLWPAGEARDYTLPGLPSQVLDRNPDVRMHSIFPEVHRGDADDRIEIDLSEPILAAVTARLTSENMLDEQSCTDVTHLLERQKGSWDCGGRDEVLYVFRLRESVGVDGGIVDLMNAEATKTFISLVYDEYERRFGEDLGKTLRGSRADHEGDYGYRLAWTPELFDRFSAAKGYDLLPLLPLLIDEGSTLTAKVRCDYFEIVASLYSENFFGILRTWSESRGLEFSGHVFEENLHSSAAFEGNHFDIQRAFEHPGMDTLFQWARQPRHFKEAASVAHFRKKPLEVEYQEVEGHDSFLSLETAKITTNAIAVWGGCVFVPGSFFAHPQRSDFPEPGYEDQPWWRYYQRYSDYVARLSYMNWDSTHVCRVLLYYPIETTWANAAPILREDGADYTFGDGTIEGMAAPVWGNIIDEIDDVYGQIVNALPEHQWDLDIVDYKYLDEAEIADGHIRIADESYDILILPPMTCMSLTAARSIQRFAASGGRVLAVGLLPRDSMENGSEDTELIRVLDAARIQRLIDVPALLDHLDANVARDVRVVSGERTHLTFRHLIKHDTHAYLINNDSDNARSVSLQFTATGRPEIWDPQDGSRNRAGWHQRDGYVEISLDLHPWQALFVVFDGAVAPSEVDGRDSGAPPEAPSRGTDADTGAVTMATRTESAPLILGGPWKMTPESDTVPVYYARSRTALMSLGEKLGWHLPEYNDAFWEERWLSPERFALRDWMAIGPFDYEWGAAWGADLPPQTECDLGATHHGWQGEKVGWTRITSNSHIVDLQGGLGGDSQSWRKLGHRSATSFAVTHIYSPDDRIGELRVAANANAMAWLNGHVVLAERDEPPLYIELRDAYAQSTMIRLTRGWNRLMLRVSAGLKAAAGYGFFARICDADGNAIPSLRSSAVRTLRPEKTTEAAERWYRVDVPAVSSGVQIPEARSARIYLNGRRLDVAADGTAVFEPLPRQILAISVPADQELPSHLQFDSHTAPQLLGSWSHTGLSFYSGSALYETTFTLDPSSHGSRLELDLGQVGVACEAWLNGQWLGDRVWRPYSFEITSFIRSGVNELRVRVCNTRANRRAGRASSRSGLAVNGPELLGNLENSGLLGPVQITVRTSGNVM